MANWATTLTTMPDETRTGAQLVENIRDWIIDTVAKPGPNEESDIREESASDDGSAYARISTRRKFSDTHDADLEVRICNVGQESAAVRIECRFISDDGTDPEHRFAGPPKFLAALLQQFQVAGGLDERAERPLLAVEPRVIRDVLAEVGRVREKKHRLPQVIVTRRRPGDAWMVDPEWLRHQLHGAAEVVGATVDTDVGRETEKALGYRWWYDAALVLEPESSSPGDHYWNFRNQWQSTGSDLQWAVAEAAIQANLNDRLFEDRYYQAMDRVELVRRLTTAPSAPPLEQSRKRELELELDLSQAQVQQLNEELDNTKLELGKAQANLRDDAEYAAQLRQRLDQSTGDSVVDPQIAALRKRVQERDATLKQERRERREEKKKLQTENTSLKRAKAEEERRLSNLEAARMLAADGIALPRDQFGYLAAVQLATNIARDAFQKEIGSRLGKKGYEMRDVYADLSKDPNNRMPDASLIGRVIESQPECLIDWDNGAWIINNTGLSEMENLRNSFFRIKDIRNDATHPKGKEYDSREAADSLRRIRDYLADAGLDDYARRIQEIEFSISA